MGVRFLKNLMVYVAFTLIANLPTARATTTCTNKISSNSCAYYLCAEEQKQCGVSAYLINFGYRFCMEFLKLDSSHFSPSGKQWLSDVRRELQKGVDQLPQNLSCDALEDESFAMHVPVYHQTGFCDLSLFDRQQIYFHLRRAVYKHDTIVNGLEILRTCAEDAKFSYSHQ